MTNWWHNNFSYVINGEAINIGLYDLTVDQREWTVWFSKKKVLIQTHVSSIIAGEIQKITVKVNCILYECHHLSNLPQHNNLSLFSGVALFSLETFSEAVFYISCNIKVT